MESNKSWLKINKIPIIPQITLKIPTVGEILDNEHSYYSLTSSLTSSPFTYMVQLDDMGIDYAAIDDWQLFTLLFCSYSNQIATYRSKMKELDQKMQYLEENTGEYMECQLQKQYFQQLIDNLGLDLVFDHFEMTAETDGQITGFQIDRDKNGYDFLYNPATGVKIDRLVHMDMADAIRKINQYEKVKFKPGNESAKKYLLDRERKKLKRNAKKKQQPYLENMVIALVNTSEFPYDYDSCMNLSIYQFNQSFKQIQHKIRFDNTMIGVYAGTVDTSRMANKDCLSWISINN